MIFYSNGGPITFVGNLFQRRGSVFPQAFGIAAPIAALSGLLRWLFETKNIQFHSLYHRDMTLPLMNESAVWGGFTFLVGFLIVFRTSIAYSRFWDGMTSTHKMRAEWFDACSSVCAFCKHSEASREKIEDFQTLLVNLFSLLHAVSMAEIEDSNSDDHSNIQGFDVTLLSDNFIDDQSLLAIRDSWAKPELVFQWIQQVIVENIRTGVLSIPPPILSRAFNELANGMVEFHEALKVSSIPFPFPYAQTCDFLLVAHGFMTPLIISQWVNDMWWAMVLSFLQLFIMWSLRCIAVELENPFGTDANDLDQHLMQEEMNAHLEILLSPGAKRTPTLQKCPPYPTSDPHDGCCNLNSAWLRIEQRAVLEDAGGGSKRLSSEVDLGVTASMKSGSVTISEGSRKSEGTARSVRATVRANTTAKSKSKKSALRQQQSVLAGETPQKSKVAFEGSPEDFQIGFKSEASATKKVQSDISANNHDAGPLLPALPLGSPASDNEDHLHLKVPNQAHWTKPANLRKSALA
mmetsp:Transcript_46587/g.85422  ORF Transcript_46587/g.85422 Transcript_46587/m.85422 type:complete len:520 (+) Transcript_46587:70-1629(+)